MAYPRGHQTLTLEEGIYMDASQADIEILIKLRELDRDIALAERDFKELPQRRAILEKRSQLAELGKKKAQVQEMLDSCENELSKIAQEDSTLEAKQNATQAKLDASRGDFRSVECLSRDLNGVVKRRSALSEQLGEVEARLAKIQPVMDQLNKALDGLGAQEQSLIASFQKEGGSLQQSLAKYRQSRDALTSSLDGPVLKEYNAALERCGGVALAVLSENSCSACRNSFEGGKLSQVKSEAPLSHCPRCGRLLLIGIV